MHGDCSNRLMWQHEGSRHDRGYGWQWVKLRAHVLRRDYYLCQPCQTAGRTTQATQVDHIIPKSQDGSDDMANLQSICDECHVAKTKLEAAQAQGRRQRNRFDGKGFPVWD